MPATCHRVVGIVDVEKNPDFLLQLAAPFGTTAFNPAPNNRRFFTTASMTAEVEQLAADLKIEYERYQRQSLACPESRTAR